MIRINTMDPEGRSSDDQRAWPLTTPTAWDHVRPQLIKFVLGLIVVIATIYALAPYLGE